MTWELIFPLVLVIAALSSPLGKVFKQPGDEAERKGTTETGISVPSGTQDARRDIILLSILDLAAHSMPRTPQTTRHVPNK